MEGARSRHPRRCRTPGDAAAPAVNYSDVATLLRLLLSLAQRELFITTAYFVPGEYTIRLLCDAVRRGVDVQIVLPGPHISKRISQLAGQEDFQVLLDAAVKLFLYQRVDPGNWKRRGPWQRALELASRPARNQT